MNLTGHVKFMGTLFCLPIIFPIGKKSENHLTALLSIEL